MAAGRLIIPQYMPAENADGSRIARAKLWFYDYSGGQATTTLKSVYSSNTLTTELANPVVADDSGVFPAIWADTTESFTVVVTDADGAPLKTYDGVSPSIDATLASATLAESAKDSAEASATAAAASASTASTAATTATTASTAAVAAAASAEAIAGFDPTDYQAVSEKGANSGYAPLNSSGKVPDTHLTTAPVSTPQQTALDNLETELKAYAVSMITAM